MFISTILINKWTQIQIPNYIYHPRKIAAKQDAYYMTIRQPPLHDFVRHKKKTWIITWVSYACWIYLDDFIKN